LKQRERCAQPPDISEINGHGEGEHGFRFILLTLSITESNYFPEIRPFGTGSNSTLLK
jgi:hypothetical protein